MMTIRMGLFLFPTLMADSGRSTVGGSEGMAKNRHPCALAWAPALDHRRGGRLGGLPAAQTSTETGVALDVPIEPRPVRAKPFGHGAELAE